MTSQASIMIGVVIGAIMLFASGKVRIRRRCLLSMLAIPHFWPLEMPR